VDPVEEFPSLLINLGFEPPAAAGKRSGRFELEGLVAY
jgi:hypothetical protein